MSKSPKKSDNNYSLKGTFVSVMIVGVVIVVSWLGIFYIFLNRG